MITEISSAEPYASFINDISNDPIFSDPHFSYHPDNLFLAGQKPNQKIFLSQNDGMVDGIFAWLIIPEEHYIELITGLSRSEAAWMTMIDYIETGNPGARIDYVFHPGHPVLTRILESRHAEFEKPQKKLRLVHQVPYDSTIRAAELLPEYENQYIALHNTETYWTAEKVLEAKGRFRVIAAIDQEELVGYLDVTSCFEENEVYDLYTTKGFEEYQNDLLAAAIQLNKPKGMMVVVDIDNVSEIALFEKHGFEPIEGSESVVASYYANGVSTA